jgi:hypothetical protein
MKFSSVKTPLMLALALTAITASAPSFARPGSYDACARRPAKVLNNRAQKPYVNGKPYRNAFDWYCPTDGS